MHLVGFIVRESCLLLSKLYLCLTSEDELQYCVCQKSTGGDAKSIEVTEKNFASFFINIYTLKMEADSTSEKFLFIHQIARHNIPESLKD